MIARASSGSRSCSSSVEPLISANSAVTVLRSPSRFSGAGVSATRIGEGFDCLAEAAAVGAASAVPHSPQKHLSAGLSAPHFGQRFASAAPQSPQNFLPAGFSVLQFEQRIGLHGKISDSPSYITQRRKGTTGIREDDRNPSPCGVEQYVTVVEGGGRDARDGPPAKQNVQLHLDGAA